MQFARAAPCASILFDLVELPEGELSSWKEIAAYLGVGLRTAQIWEQERALPVHRLPGGRGRVIATVAELDAWKRSGGLHVTKSLPAAPSLPATREDSSVLPVAAIIDARVFHRHATGGAVQPGWAS